MSTALELKKRLAARSEQIRELKGKSLPKAGLELAVEQGAAFTAGFIDRAAADIDLPIDPSLGIGLLGLGAGVAMGSPTVIKGAGGMLAPHSYDLGETAFDAMFADDEDEDE